MPLTERQKMLLEDAKKDILACPQYFDMNYFALNGSVAEKMQFDLKRGQFTRESECRTSCCIGGWMWLRHGDEGSKKYHGWEIVRWLQEPDNFPAKEPQSLLQDDYPIFFLSDWPQEAIDMMNFLDDGRGNDEQMALVAASVIDHFIDVDGNFSKFKSLKPKGLPAIEIPEGFSRHCDGCGYLDRDCICDFEEPDEDFEDDEEDDPIEDMDGDYLEGR